MKNRLVWLLVGLFLAIVPAALLAKALHSVWPIALLIGVAFLVPPSMLWSLVAGAPPKSLSASTVWLPRTLLAALQLPWYASILRRVARAFGARIASRQWPQELAIPVEGATVCLRRPHPGALNEPFALSVAGFPLALDIEPENLRKRVGKALGAEDVLTGDADFDRALFVRGTPSAVLALLDADTRRRLLQLAQRWDVRLVDGRLTLESRLAPRGVGRVVRAVVDMAALGRRAADRLPRFESMARSALHDPVVGVRLANIEALARDRERSREVLRKALSDPSEEVRARAAMWLGAEGRDTLLTLLGDPALDVDLAVASIRSLRAQLPEFRGLEILKSSLAGARRPVALAAIESLGLVGSVNAVPSLRAVVEEHLLDLGLRRAAHGAIAHIQSRLEGAEAGQLSVADAEAEAGQLSLDDSEAGQLSLDPPSAPQSRPPRTVKTTE